MNWKKLFTTKPKPPLKQAKYNAISYGYSAGIFVGVFAGLLVNIDNIEFQEALGLRLYHILATVFLGGLCVFYVMPAILHALRWYRLRQEQ